MIKIWMKYINIAKKIRKTGRTKDVSTVNEALILNSFFLPILHLP
ncbi:MAG TPA: hypothetical protein PK304_01280 [Mobilitalea sp.]|nr:hypothetical protein [Mobilitalea sp.]